jgi:hypothetical protein
MREIPANSNARQNITRRPRFWVSALVIGQLTVAFAAAALDSLLDAPFSNFLYSHLPDHLADSVFTMLGCGVFGIQVGQVVLLAAWAGFAGQRTFLRIPRFLILCAWLLLFGLLGVYVIDGEISKLLVEEKLAYTLIQFLIPLVVLFVFGLACRRQFIHRDSRQMDYRWQFNIRGLLLITAELAALLALARLVLPSHFRIEEIWPALTQLRNYEYTPLVVSTTMLPAIFFGLVRQRTWRGYLLLGIYFCIPAFMLAMLRISQFRDWGLAMTDDQWSFEGFLSFFGSLIEHLSAAATILLTFYFLRRIGYDFRRRDELPRLGSSSNASNSAASASA